MMSSEDRAREVNSIANEANHRVVAGVDGSAASLRAIEWAVRHAELIGATLEIVTAWEWPNTFGWSVIPSEFNPKQDAQKLLESLVASLREAHPHVAITWKVVEGHPAPVLLNASKGADLLVVGSRGHGEFVGMLIGSTSEHCVANATCPVVVFREKA
jgi:nucleotide-binding universal stress UspA family protein